MSSFLSFQQFQQLSPTEQQIQLEKRFQCLFDTQVQVNSVIKTCRNYEYMISPYNDIYLLKQNSAEICTSLRRLKRQYELSRSESDFLSPQNG